LAGGCVMAREASPPAPAPAAVYVHVSELRPNAKNPRAHGGEITRLARTILRTAWGAPIVAQARSRRIIAGHGRHAAALLILAGLELDGEARGGAEHRFDPAAPGPGMVPVRFVDVSDAEADAMTVADNATGLQGTDDAAALLAMLSGFGRGTDLLAEIGYDDAALDALVKGAGNAVLSAAPPSSTSSPGDVERHEIIGDAPPYRGDPDGREYDESVEADVPSIDCPHCGGKVPRG